MPDDSMSVTDSVSVSLARALPFPCPECGAKEGKRHHAHGVWVCEQRHVFREADRVVVGGR